MTKMVWGCFQWVGFHLIREWLDEGESIVGIDAVNTEQEETLEMFVGRNANFTRYDSIEECLSLGAGNQYESLIVLEDDDYNPPLEKLTDIPASSYFRVGLKDKAQSINQWTTIDLPHVYGPWMRNDITDITEESIYITDVTPTIKSIIKDDWNINLVKVGMENNEERNDKCITPTVSLEEGMQMMRDHKKRFPAYY